MGNAASIGRQLRREVSTTVRTVMLLARRNVAAATPVDTGHAMSNWVLSVGKPYTGVCGSRQDVDFSAQNDGDLALSDYDVGRDGAVYLRNNVHYVTYLDDGSSQQAEAGFVAEAIQSAQRLAPYGRGGAVRRMLSSMARQAIVRRSGFGSRTSR